MSEGFIKLSSSLRFGPPPYGNLLKKLIEDYDTKIIVNLRKETGYTSKPTESQRNRYDKLDDGQQQMTSRDSAYRYEFEIMAMGMSNQVYIIHHPMASNDMDIEDKEFFSLAQTILKKWKEDPIQSIYIHGRDGKQHEAVLAFTLFSLMEHDGAFKPLEWLKQIGAYEVCIAKASREQLKRLWAHGEKKFNLVKLLTQPKKKKQKTNNK